VFALARHPDASYEASQDSSNCGGNLTTVMLIIVVTFIILVVLADTNVANDQRLPLLRLLRDSVC
jgi:hypothetical protein